MGISGSKSKLKKGGGRPEGWYKLTNCRWEQRTSQRSGDDYIVFASDGEQSDADSPTEILLFLGMANKVGEYVRVDDDGALKSVDDDEEFEIPENSGVGRFFASLTDAGVSDKIMDNIGDEPEGLNGLYVRIDQEEVLDKDGEPKMKDGYPVTNTIVGKLGTAKDAKSGGRGKGKSKPEPAGKKKGKTVVDDDDDDEEEEEEEEEEDQDEEDDDDDDDDEPAPPRRGGKAKGKKR